MVARGSHSPSVGALSAGVLEAPGAAGRTARRRKGPKVLGPKSLRGSKVARMVWAS